MLVGKRTDISDIICRVFIKDYLFCSHLQLFCQKPKNKKEDNVSGLDDKNFNLKSVQRKELKPSCAKHGNDHGMLKPMSESLI